MRSIASNLAELLLAKFRADEGALDEGAELEVATGGLGKGYLRRIIFFVSRRPLLSSL